MLFNCKYILLILCVSLKTTLSISSNLLNYKIPVIVFEKFSNEFDKFEAYSSEAKEFEKKYYCNIKKYVRDDPNNPKKFLELLYAAKSFLYDANDEGDLIIKAFISVKTKCMGHYCDASSKSELESFRKKYLEDSSIAYIGDNEFYSEEDQEYGLKSAVFGGTSCWLCATGLLAAGPIGWACVGGMALGSGFFGYKSITKEEKLLICRFKYKHKDDFLDECSNVIGDDLYSTENLSESLEQMICILEKYIDGQRVKVNVDVNLSANYTVPNKRKFRDLNNVNLNSFINDAK